MKALSISSALAGFAMATQPVMAQEAASSDPVKTVSDVECYVASGLARAFVVNENTDKQLEAKLDNTFWYYRGFLNAQNVEISKAVVEYLSAQSPGPDKEKNTKDIIEKANFCAIAAGIPNPAP